MCFSEVAHCINFELFWEFRDDWESGIEAFEGREFNKLEENVFELQLLAKLKIIIEMLSNSNSLGGSLSKSNFFDIRVKLFELFFAENLVYRDVGSKKFWITELYVL